MKYIKILSLVVLIGGCASTTHDHKQRVIVYTPGAPKAECTLVSESMGTLQFSTPEAVEIPRSSEVIQISCRKKCFLEETKTFDPSLNVDDLTSNIYFGGAAPLAIDLVTKKGYNYTYDFVIRLKPDPKCPVKRKGYLDGNPRDFDNRIEDFTLYDPLKTMPEKTPNGANPTPNTTSPEPTPKSKTNEI